MGLILIPYSLSFQSVFYIYYSYNPVSAVLQIVMLVFSHSLISFFSFFFPPLQLILILLQCCLEP